jgi:hypothetical protein
VEGPHCELCPRLADRLSRDNANGLADIDGRTARQIATVAVAAHAAFAFAGQDGPDQNGFDTCPLDLADMVFFHRFTGRNQHLARQRVDDIDRRGPPEDPFTERDDHLAALENFLDGQTIGTAAITLDNDAVL